MSINQKRNLIPPECSLQLVQPAIPTFVISECGERAEARLNSGDLLHAFRQIRD